MAAENPSWGQERIADGLKLRLGIFGFASDSAEVLNEEGTPANAGSRAALADVHP